MLDEAAARESELKELERKAIEARLGDQLSFTVTQTARILNRSNEWTRQKVNSGKLRAVWLDGKRTISRFTIIDAYLEGI
jgi:hypothetical protein